MPKQAWIGKKKKSGSRIFPGLIFICHAPLIFTWPGGQRLLRGSRHPETLPSSGGQWRTRTPFRPKNQSHAVEVRCYEPDCQRPLCNTDCSQLLTLYFLAQDIHPCSPMYQLGVIILANLPRVEKLQLLKLQQNTTQFVISYNYTFKTVIFNLITVKTETVIFSHNLKNF